jgi:hypothetical protein
MMRIHDVVAKLELDVLERQDEVLQQLLFGVGNDALLASCAGGGRRVERCVRSAGSGPRG